MTAVEAPTLFLMVGRPASGKTTRARGLEATHPALRFTPDEWMIPLYAESTAGGKRDVLEGRLISVALSALPLGTSAILDFGLWGRDERSALVWLAESLGARASVQYLEVDEATQLKRANARFATAPHTTFEMTTELLEQWRRSFEIPDEDELTGVYRPDPPSGFETWSGWASNRWPSLPSIGEWSSRREKSAPGAELPSEAAIRPEYLPN